METRRLQTLKPEADMDTIYGEIDSTQFESYKDQLHKKIFWLLLYKDPVTCDEFSYVNFDKYFNYLMKEIVGQSDMLSNPPELIQMMTMLQAAYNETLNDPFDYKAYRKLVLDAHQVLDRIECEEVDV